MSLGSLTLDTKPIQEIVPQLMEGIRPLVTRLKLLMLGTKPLGTSLEALT
jgi:hypothetical protein